MQHYDQDPTWDSHLVEVLGITISVLCLLLIPYQNRKRESTLRDKNASSLSSSLILMYFFYLLHIFFNTTTLFHLFIFEKISSYVLLSILLLDLRYAFSEDPKTEDEEANATTAAAEDEEKARKRRNRLNTIFGWFVVPIAIYIVYYFFQDIFSKYGFALLDLAILVIYLFSLFSYLLRNKEGEDEGDSLMCQSTFLASALLLLCNMLKDAGVQFVTNTILFQTLGTVIFSVEGAIFGSILVMVK